MEAVLIGLYFLLFLFLSIKNLKWGIYWIIFTSPIYLIRFSVFNLPMTLLEGEIVLLFLLWAVKEVKHVKQVKLLDKKLLYCYIAILLFLIAATISMFVSPDLRVAAGIWKAYFIEPILFLIVFVSVIKKEDFRNIFKVFGWQVLILSLFAIYQKFTGVFIFNDFWAAEATRRVTSIFPYPNALALYLAPIVVMLIGYIVGTRHRRVLEQSNALFLQLFLALSIIVGLLAIYWTRSKGALLALLTGLIFYAIFYKGYRKIFVGILICVFVFLCFCVFVTGLPNLKGMPTVEGGDSISTRLDTWQETWQMLKTRPILGAGLAGYQTAVASFHTKDYIEIYLYPHNIFLNFWTEIGLLGLIAFILIIVWFYKIGFVETRFIASQNSGLKAGGITTILMSGMTALLVHGLVDVPYFKNDLAILFWIIIAAMVILWRGGRVLPAGRQGLNK